MLSVSIVLLLFEGAQVRVDLFTYLFKVIELWFQLLSGLFFFFKLFMQLRNISLSWHFANLTLRWHNLRGRFHYCWLFILLLALNFIKNLLFHGFLLFCWNHGINSIYVDLFFLLLKLLFLFQIRLLWENAWFLWCSWNLRSSLRDEWFWSSFLRYVKHFIKSLYILFA